MNSLLEKKKLKDILPRAIDIIFVAAVAALLILLAVMDVMTAELGERSSAETAGLEAYRAELVKEVSAAREKYETELTAAKAIYEAAAEKEAKIGARHSELAAELEQLEQDIADTIAYPEKIEQAKREYASAIAELEKLILSGKSSVKIAYLTFDDGPYRNTAAILDTLKEHDAKATFFTNGHRNYAELLRRELQEGHAVANHTYSHGISTGLYSSVESFMHQVEKQNDFVKETTGFETKLVRFPGGSNTAGRLKGSIKTALTEAGYGWADWDALTGDSTAGAVITRDYVMSNLKNTVKDKSITVILLHDLKKITKNTIDETLDYLEGEGYIFLPLFYESCKVNK